MRAMKLRAGLWPGRPTALSDGCDGVTWDAKWRAAINGLRAIGTGDESAMERALNEIDHLAMTL